LQWLRVVEATAKQSVTFLGRQSYRKEYRPRIDKNVLHAADAQPEKVLWRAEISTVSK